MGITVNISNSTVNRSSGINWTSYWTSRSLFFLDGTIISSGGNYYFKDRSSAARNFLITGYDLDSTWTKGFPYKSAATISAPAGDATLIAADINNFLYDAGGTPNAIPVVSLFQNIDYENTIYCRHVAQVVDGNGVETYEPRVMEVFMTKAPLTASELVKADDYFGVPVKSATALWVAKDGNDTTGNGTEALPYLTIAKFIAVGNGKTCYLKTGAYNEKITFNNKQVNIKGVGFNLLISTTSGTFDYSGATSITTIERISAIVALANKVLKQAATGALIFNNIRLIGGTNDIRDTAGTGTGIVIKDSYLTSKIEAKGDVTLNGCYYKPVASLAGGIYASAEKKVTMNNCKIGEITSTGMFKAIGVGAELYLFNCSNYGNLYVDEINDYAPKITILYSAIIAATKAILAYATNTGSRIIAINNNTIVTGGVVNQLFALTGKGTVEINNNTITGLAKAFTMAMNGLDVDSNNDFKNNVIHSSSFTITANNTNGEITNNIFDVSTGSNIVTTVSIALLDVVVRIENNLLNSPNTGSAVIQLGTEGGDVSYNRMNGSVITKNKSLCYSYYGNAFPGAQHWVLIYANTVEASYNYINGTYLGWVMKSAGGTNNSIIRHNLIVDTSNPCLSKGVIGVSYINNTLIWKKAMTKLALVIMADELYEGSESTGTIFKNNIVVDFTSDYDTQFIEATDEDLVNCEIDYNIYYKGNGLASTHFAYLNGTTWLSFAEWQALGFDTHSIILSEAQALALFTDYVNGDYSLKTGSAAIGVGVDLGATLDDGLDASTDWGADTELPTIVTKQQGAAWDCGAYVS